MQKIDIRTGVKALKSGKLIVYPTDTLYALGADISNQDAVKLILRVKERPESQPLPVAVASLEEMEKIAEVTPSAKKVVKKFLPGPLTVVLKRKNGALEIVSGGQGTLAIRIPKNEVALNLLLQVGPLTVTSANIHNNQPCTDIPGIQEQLKGKEIELFLDVGRLEGKPSTIVDLTGEKPRILRKGVITENEIRDAIEHG